MGSLESKVHGMSAREELPFLKSRARALSVRLDRLNLRIIALQQGSGTPLSVAVVDTEKCLGCGVCERACPIGAISVKEVASVNPERCIGCGRCICECPQGAIRLYPATLHREGRPRRGHALRRERPIRPVRTGHRVALKRQ